MSSGSFASLSSSEDDDIPQSKIINTSTTSFHLQMENSDSGSDEGSKTVEDTSIQEKGPSESPLPNEEDDGFPFRNLDEDLDDQGEKIKELHQLLRRIDLHEGAGAQRKGNKTAIHVPAHIKQAVCDAYRHGTTENNLVWTCKTAAGSILKGDKWRRMEKRPHTTEKCFFYGRKNRKLQNRVKALQAKKLPVSEDDKLMKAVKIDFMSSEDSDSEDETRLITKPLTWLSKDFKSYMDKLDSNYQR
ncbi:unnamed protein product [Mytilus coruscus]|uniref:Uncharacterized protein n=1 Tax=Mytilus coruscus TaxID=42192 RepID=A0A6J8DZM0_MYTCO|nr:unnamed protein product [Mytilus coruscus]